jgi:hypothetical protein
LENGQNKFCLEVRGRGENGGRGQGAVMAQTIYTHMNKCINNKKDVLKKRNSWNRLFN